MEERKQRRRRFTPEFKQEAVGLVTEQGYSISQAARAVDVSENNLRRWKKNREQESRGERLTTGQREELNRLRRENRELRMEKDILKKRAPSLRRK